MTGYGDSATYTIPQQFERVRAHLYHDACVIGSALADLPTVIHETTIPGFETAWVDGKNIHWDLAFFLSLNNAQRKFIYAHEILHWLLGHFWRQGNRNMTRCNIAMDYAINGMLVEDYPNVMERPKDTLYDPKYRGLSFEQIYELLPLELDRSTPQQGTGDPTGEQGWGHHDAWGNGVDEDGNTTPLTPTESDGFIDLPQQWEGKLAEAMNFAKQMGKTPLGLARHVGPLLNPVLPLKRLLLPYLSAGASDYTMTPTDRRFTHANMFLPSVYDDENIEDFVVAFDLSGSIDDEDIQGYLTELSQMLKIFPRMRGWMMTCDTQVHTFLPLNAKLPPTDAWKGVGGSDFRCLYTELETRKITPKIMLFFTDLYGTMPEKKPRYPHITICTTDEIAPFGKTVQYLPRPKG